MKLKEGLFRQSMRGTRMKSVLIVSSEANLLVSDWLLIKINLITTHVQLLIQCVNCSFLGTP